MCVLVTLLLSPLLRLPEALALTMKPELPRETPRLAELSLLMLCSPLLLV